MSSSLQLSNQGGVAFSSSNNVTFGEVTASIVTVSQSISAYNINNGNPTSNTWQTNLNGSYFNNFTPQTNVSEILRFIAGILSSSAPDASPNTKTFGSYSTATVNGTTGTVTAGSIPSGSSNTTIQYLQSRGFANTGSTIFNGISTIYTAQNYYNTYTSVAVGTTTVSSSNDSQLFGLGQLNGGTPTTFNVSGAFAFKFKNNSTNTDTATSASFALITQTGAGTTNGVTLAKINTVSPAVIPSAYQDGKFASIFSAGLYSGSSSPAVSASGYYHISSSISISSGSSPYTPISSSNAQFFWAPLSTISTNVPLNPTITTGSTVVVALTATSRSLSGAPYLTGGTYTISSSVSGAFNPLYYAGTGIGNISVSGTGVAYTSGVNTVSTLGGTVQTANAVYDSTGTVVRATSTIPGETDIIKASSLYTFSASTNTNISQTGLGTATYTLTVNAVNKNAANTAFANSVSYHTAGAFGQPVSSGSLAYWGRVQGSDTATNNGASNLEPFLGETYRIVVNDNILSFTGTPWITASYGVYNLTGDDLQVKPGYLVKPGGSYGYWLVDPDATKTYKYYVRKFTTNAATKTAMTLNLGQVLSDWQTAGTNSVSVLILFQSSNSSFYTPARFYDPTKTTSNFVTNISANTDGQNPFGSAIALYGNTGGSVSATTYTIPVRNADGMVLDASNTNIYVIVRYRTDPTPITSITVTFT